MISTKRIGPAHNPPNQSLKSILSARSLFRYTELQHQRAINDDLLEQSLSSRTPTLFSADIASSENQNVVFAMHTFVANLEGQVCVLKGDLLALLDDSNSYWWLVRCLKTAEVGYIPAENIEVRTDELPIEKHFFCTNLR
jgi:hypothetical protein